MRCTISVCLDATCRISSLSTSERAFRALLREARLEAGLRQQDVADRLGVPQSVVSKIESGERRLDDVELRRAYAALGLPLADFAARLEAAPGAEAPRGDAGPRRGHRGRAVAPGRPRGGAGRR